MSMYLDHRRRFLACLAEFGAAAVIPTSTVKTRSNDTDYRFRPDSDFWYLTGFAEPASVLVLLPARDGEGAGRSVLFLRERDREREIWDGRRLGLERACDVLDVDEAHPIESLWSELPRLLSGYERIVWRTGADEERDRRMLDLLATLRGRARGGVLPPLELLDPAPLLHELRLHKSEAELALMRRAAEVTAEAHLSCMATAAPGVNECELDALLDFTFRSRGGTGQAYNNIVAGGDNANILHYIENDAPLADGDLILIDAGCEFEHYAADVTRTFPVNGTFSDAQRALYEVVLRAETAAIEQVRPGSTLDEVHAVALEVLVDGMLEVGLLQGDKVALIEDGAFRAYFMHKTSHWLGLDVHDVGAYHEDGQPRPLEPGMVLTVEPGLYVAADSEAPERFRGIGIRIEDDVLVTADGHEVLTAAVPKSVEDVEAACAAASALARS